MRKIIQIAVAGVENNAVTQRSESLYALCDDGTLWIWHWDDWYKMEPIPQDSAEQTKEAATSTGRHYGSVDDMLLGEGISREIRDEVGKLEKEVAN